MSEISELFKAIQQAAEEFEAQPQAVQTPKRDIHVNYNSFNPKTSNSSFAVSGGAYNYKQSGTVTNEEQDEGNEFHDENAHKLENIEKLKPNVEAVKPQIVCAKPEKEEISNKIFKEVTRDDLIRGVIMSEVLGRPRALSPISRSFSCRNVGKIK